MVRPKFLAASEKRLTMCFRASSVWARRAQSSANSSSVMSSSIVFGYAILLLFFVLFVTFCCTLLHIQSAIHRHPAALFIYWYELLSCESMMIDVFL